MVSVVSGSNLATSLRELDHPTPQTQHQAILATARAAQHSVLQAKTDTVNFSKDALAKSKEAEKHRDKSSEDAPRSAAQRPQGQK